MEPEQSQKSTRKSEESIRRRLTKGEALQGSISSAAAFPECSSSSQAIPPVDVTSPPQFTTVKRKVGRPKLYKGPSFEHAQRVPKLQQQSRSPAFMAPGNAEHSLEGPTWQLVDPPRPAASGAFPSPGLHSHGQHVPSQASVMSGDDSPSVQKVYVHRPSQVSLKQVEEGHKKEKKPQKPGKYICQYCSRPCAKPSVLQKHIRSHTGERPYPCTACGFSFKTKSNLYKHRKSHAHRIKAGLASGLEAEMYPSSLEMESLGREECEEPTEGESTDSEEETGTMVSQVADLPARQKHSFSPSSSYGTGSQSTSFEHYSLSHSSMSQSLEESTPFAEQPSDPVFSHKPEDTHSIKQKLALRLSERKKVIEEQPFLSPGSKGSTESGYFSRSESAEQQISPPNTNAKSYTEIIFGKCGRFGQKTATTASQGVQHEEKTSIPLSVPRTQVIEHITKLITINEAVVDTSEIDSVKPRRSSLSRRSSIESPKAGAFRDPFQFDIKSPGPITQLDASKTMPFQGERHTPEQSFLSLQQTHSATETTVPLLRSHSMPSAACTISSPHAFRASYSLDSQLLESPEVLSRSHVFSSHPRMLKRQPAIELPVGMDYSSEEFCLISKDALYKHSEDQDPKESDPNKKSRKGPKLKGLMYECNICGARYKKRDNYEAHKKYYCTELQIPMPVSVESHKPLEVGKGLAEHDPSPQVLQYKTGSVVELAPLRKRRKEKSLGDDEDPPGYVMTKSEPSSRTAISQFPSPISSDVALCPTPETSSALSEASKELPPSDVRMEVSLGDPPLPLSAESKQRRTTSKEISVIQHTSSFEKSESMEQMSGLEEEDISPVQSSSQPAPQHARSLHALQSKLVRQPNIQVPEILVTEEPDRPEYEPEPPPKEPEKVEEFQWPQRSQTLSELPTEKLPPKKKRLRLAELAQSSGESSFESVTLTRSPSQESSVSHASSHSISFEREEYSKTESSAQSSEPLNKPFGAHMLTVPTQHHHPAREMRRSASEQTPNVSHTVQISENRSKSFDYGSLSSAASSGHPPSSSAQEKRKCFQTRQASLSRHVEHDPDVVVKGWKEVDESLSSSKSSVKRMPHSSSVVSHGDYPPDKSQPKESPVDTQPMTEALQVFHPSTPQLALHETSYLPMFPVQHLLQQPELFSTQAMSELLSTQFPFPQIPPSLFQTPQLPLQPTLLHPSQLQIAHQLMSHPMEIPFRPQPPYFPMHYTGSSAISPAFFLPLPSPFSLQVPVNIGDPLSQTKAMSSPPLASSNVSACKESQLQPLTLTTSSAITEPTSQMVVPACSDPVMSLVVPVRIQTHMPSYGSAMYTTLSQILVTQSHGSPSSLFIRKFDDSRPKGVHGVGFDLAQMISEDQRSLFQSPYLRVPLPTMERRGFVPLASLSESDQGLDGNTSTAGGSKRMLSPAGSLELTMETQQQKRVKEEEVSESEEKLELPKSTSATLASVAEGNRKDQSKFSDQVHCRAKVDMPLTSSSDRSTPKEIPTCLHQTSYSESLEDYKIPVDKQHRSKLPLQPVKKEDSPELEYQPPCSPMSTAPVSGLKTGATSSEEGSDMKKVPKFPSLHTTTNVTWCYLNYIKPNHIQQADRKSSVYASWCISLYNPNLPGISTKAALSLLRSKQRLSKEIYSMAMVPRPETGRLAPSNTRKPKMSEVHLPARHSSEGRKEPARVEKEDEKRGKAEDEAAVTVPKRAQPARIRIFEGGYKSNEEYVYVRGRGRGKYVCEECGIRCKKPSMLKKHIRTHTDVRPYVCKYCNFAFKTKGNLTKHMKSKAHSKKCQEMGVLVSFPLDLEADEGTSEELFQDSDGREGSEAIEEHQFSDLDDTDDDDDEDDEDDDDDDDDNDEEDEDDEEESQEEPSLKSGDIKHAHHQIVPPSSQEDIIGSTSLSKPDVGSKCQPTAGPQLVEAELSVELSENPVGHILSGIHRPYLTSSEHLSTAERESVTRPQMFLGMDLSVSKDTSPRRRWSSSKGSALSRRYLLTKNETSPKRFSPTGEMSPLRCSSPGRRMSPCHRMSPGRELSPLRCVSPSRHMSPRKDLSPRSYLSPERGLSPVHHFPPSREISLVRFSTLKQVLSPCEPEISSRYQCPGKDELPTGSKTDVKAQSTLNLEHGLPSSLALPQKHHSKSIEGRTSKLKFEPELSHARLAYSPISIAPSCLRTFPTAHDFHAHGPRVDENVFSHLPLHSQQLSRAPYPMIPIGGIQMVQSRPSSHPVFAPGSVVSLQPGVSSTNVRFTEFSLVGTRCAEKGDICQPSSTSPSLAVQASKFSPQTKSCISEQRKTRTKERLLSKTEQEEYRVKQYAEAQHSELESSSKKVKSPSTDPELSPQPSTSRDAPLKNASKKQCSNFSTYYDSSCTFISDCPVQTMDRSSSTGCLAEPSTSQSHSLHFSIRRRNLSGEPSHLLETHRKSSSQSECVGSGQVKKLEDKDTG
ncbi:transcription factor HIVEP3 [Ambystoma mexicanum]|uniref:transcription factor HIVEP3 n=1 Tax=Ambystoma mexicanum TaxID=8296 RepID=UPI0037E9B695